MVSMSRPIGAVVGTAGHVDHGKTTLVAALTGMETDRLREEKERGISIELGFAWMDLDPWRIAFVDVPGHERFLRHMIAGVAGIDLVLLVVAADEGVMPQTREHLAICELLGVPGGGVVLTKADMVEEDWLLLVREDLRDALAGTFLEGAPVVEHGKDDPAATDGVRAMIASLVAQGVEREGSTRGEGRPFKLSVDRVFTMRGFGTVVTGTTQSGRVQVGDQLTVLPGGVGAKVRGIETHGTSVDAAAPGVRAAINLQGVDHDEMHRGDVLTHPDGLVVTRMFDGTLRTLGHLNRPLPDRARLLVHIGTAQLEATLAWVTWPPPQPGETGYAQIHLGQAIAVLPGEAFVLRGFSKTEGYGSTVGGGRVLTQAHWRHRRQDREREVCLEVLEAGVPEDMVVALTRFSAQRGVAVAGLSGRLAASAASLREAVDGGVRASELVEAGGRLYDRLAIKALANRALEQLQVFHGDHPALAGVGVEELRSRVRADLAQAVWGAVIDTMMGSGALVKRGDMVALATFVPTRSPEQERACAEISAILREAGLTPPRVSDLGEAAGVPGGVVEETLELLRHGGEVVRVARDLVYDADALAALQARLVAYLEERETIDTAAFKEMTGASRKWTIPLSEYFDRIRITLRVGDVRRLRTRDV